MAKRSLLLVDGDTRSLRVLEVSLKKAGFNVTTAVNGRDALDKVPTAMPDLIISDTDMPEMDGFEFCRNLKELPQWQEIPFIFLTNQAGIENKIRGLELGVEDYLTKPIYIKEILTRVRILLQKRARSHIEAKKDASTRFVGNITDMGVVDLIQTIEVSRKTGLIHFSGPAGIQATIYFRDGKIIDAEAGHLQGEDAIYRLLTWVDGEFEVIFRSVRRKDVIRMSSQGLLMEGMRRLDEWGRLCEQLPPLQTAFQVDYDELWDRLAELPDELNPILRLFDGHRSLLDVIDRSGFGDLECLEIVAKLFFEGIIIERESVSPHPERAATAAQVLVGSADTSTAGAVLQVTEGEAGANGKSRELLEAAPNEASIARIVPVKSSLREEAEPGTVGGGGAEVPGEQGRGPREADSPRSGSGEMPSAKPGVEATKESATDMAADDPASSEPSLEDTHAAESSPSLVTASVDTSWVKGSGPGADGDTEPSAPGPEESGVSAWERSAMAAWDQLDPEERAAASGEPTASKSAESQGPKQRSAESSSETRSSPRARANGRRKGTGHGRKRKTDPGVGERNWRDPASRSQDADSASNPPAASHGIASSFTQSSSSPNLKSPGPGSSSDQLRRGRPTQPMLAKHALRDEPGRSPAALEPSTEASSPSSARSRRDTKPRPDRVREPGPIRPTSADAVDHPHVEPGGTTIPASEVLERQARASGGALPRERLQPRDTLPLTERARAMARAEAKRAAWERDRAARIAESKPRPLHTETLPPQEPELGPASVASRLPARRTAPVAADHWTGDSGAANAAGPEASPESSPPERRRRAKRVEPVARARRESETPTASMTGSEETEVVLWADNGDDDAWAHETSSDLGAVPEVIEEGPRPTLPGPAPEGPPPHRGIVARDGAPAVEEDQASGEIELPRQAIPEGEITHKVISSEGAEVAVVSGDIADRLPSGVSARESRAPAPGGLADRPLSVVVPAASDDSDVIPPRTRMGIVVGAVSGLIVLLILVFALQGDESEVATVGGSPPPDVQPGAQPDAGGVGAAISADASRGVAVTPSPDSPPDAAPQIVSGPADAAPRVVGRAQADAAPRRVSRPIDAGPRVVRSRPDAAPPRVVRSRPDAAPPRVVVRASPDAAPAGPSFDELLASAKQARRKGDNRGALRLVDQALAVKAAGRAHVLKADIQVSLGDRDGAIESLTRASKLSAGNPHVWRKKGLLHWEQEDYGKARPALERYLKLRPNAPDADDVRAILDVM